MFHYLKSFIENLQNSDEVRKKRWLWGLSIASTFLIIILWFGYMNLTIENISEPKLESVQSVDESGEPGLWQVIGRGFNVAIQKVKTGLGNSFAYFGEKTKQPRSMFIEGREQDFVLEEAEEIKPTELP